MHQRAIDRQLWADIFEECTNVTRTVPDPKACWLVTTARHPDLGPINATEDEHSMIMLLSQNPPEARDPNYRLDEPA